MAIDYSVPFYSNTPDDTHCFQAALRMVLKYFEPKKEFSWEDLDKYTEKIDDLWTWPNAGLLWIASLGYEVKDIELFDYEKFVHEGVSYIYKEFGEEVGDAQENHADMQQGIILSKKLLEKNLWEKRMPNIEDIKKFLDEEYLVVCNVNAAKLNDKEGYVGHSTVMKGYTDKEFVLHDPGLPPQENRKVKFEDFEAAWAYPNENAKNIMAFKLNK